MIQNEKKNKTKRVFNKKIVKTVMRLLILLLFVIATVSFTYVYFYKPKKTSDNFILPSEENTVNDVHRKKYSVSNDLKASKIVFKNSSVSYSFIYPSDMLFKEIFDDKENAISYSFFLTQKDLEMSSWENVSSLFSLSISYQQEPTEIISDKLVQNASRYGIPTEFTDTQGRVWTVAGPTWGDGDASGSRSEIKIGDYYYSIVLRINGNNYSNYLRRELISRNGDSYDASMLIKAHYNMNTNILNSFVVE